MDLKPFSDMIHNVDIFISVQSGSLQSFKRHFLSINIPHFLLEHGKGLVGRLWRRENYIFYQAASAFQKYVTSGGRESSCT